MKICDYELTGLQYQDIPEHNIKSLELLITELVPTSGFLESLLDNDLRMTMARADTENRKHIRELTMLVYNIMPGCFGFKGSMQKFIKTGDRYHITQNGTILLMDEITNG